MQNATVHSKIYPRSLSMILLMILLFICPTVLLSQTAKPDDAVEELYAEAQAAQRSGDLNKAIEKYLAILKISPRLAPAYNNLGLLYFGQNNYQLAAKAFEDGLRIDGRMTPSLVLLGISYFQMNQHAKARDALEKALRLNPVDEQAQLYLGRSLFSLGHQADGAAVLQKLIQKSPKNTEALYTLGQMYMKLAAGTLKQLEVQAPDSYLTHLISGQALEGMQNYDEALAQYKKAIAKQPDFRGAHYNLGNIYWLEGKWTEAIAELKQELSSDPYNCLALWKIGNSLINTKEDADTALKYVESSLQLCPNLAQAHLDYGRLLADKGEYQKAVASYRRVVELDPEEASVHFLLANAYRKMGLTAEADAEAKIVHEMNQKAQRARESRIENSTARPQP